MPAAQLIISGEMPSGPGNQRRPAAVRTESTDSGRMGLGSTRPLGGRPREGRGTGNTGWTRAGIRRGSGRLLPGLSRSRSAYNAAPMNRGMPTQ